MDDPPPVDGGASSAIWANSGEDKIVQRDLRAARGDALANATWDGTQISLFAARNETVSFNLVIEASEKPAIIESISLDGLVGPGGARISSEARGADDGLFDWRNRPIEFFVVGYLPIKGLSLVSYDTYDERHLPQRFQRPWTGDGEGIGGWSDRPDHDAAYPDIAIPIELIKRFEVAEGGSQSVWCDVYIPLDAPAGTYAGVVRIESSGGVSELPVELTVWDFSLPEAPTAKTMAYLGFDDVVTRYFGSDAKEIDADRLQRIRDRHFQLAHRHRVSLIDDNAGLDEWDRDEPRPDWLDRLSGALFTPERGYDGPGLGVSNGIFSIGTYGTWVWSDAGEEEMRTRTDAWESWFLANFPDVERFLYLSDEPDDQETFAQIEQWASWIRANPGPGGSLRSFVTAPAPLAAALMPSVDIVASWSTLGDADEWFGAFERRQRDPRRRSYLYNSFRPFTGTFAIEDDGVALRQIAWTHFKHGVNRWFYWETTYYNNFQAGAGETNVFRQAQTFGENERTDNELGRTGWQYGNGDGVLFYPGTDRVFPNESYDIDGPIASLRLKHWRRGIQDVEYLRLAAAKDAVAVSRIVSDMVPTTLWQYGVSDPNDRTFVLAPVSWSDNPDDWDSARRRLAEIIMATE